MRYASVLSGDFPRIVRLSECEPGGPPVEQRPQPLTHESSSVGARSSSAAPVDQNHHAQKEALSERTKALMDRYPLYPHLAPTPA